MRVSGSENLGSSHFGPFSPSIGGLKRTNVVPPLNGYQVEVDETNPGLQGFWRSIQTQEIQAADDDNDLIY